MAWRKKGGWGVSGVVDRDRTVSSFITRIVTVLSVNNYQRWRTVVNLAFTDWLSLLACPIRQGESASQRWKLRKCDERRWGGEALEGGKSHTYMANLPHFWERAHLCKRLLRQNWRASREKKGWREAGVLVCFLKQKPERSWCGQWRLFNVLGKPQIEFQVSGDKIKPRVISNQM